jgi:lipopolysaccharide biosynthesis protein
MHKLYDAFEFNTKKGPAFADEASLPTTPPANSALRLIAYYLPQFHAISENDAWWGTGFTEWTNVTKALPRYIGHRQPKLPADLGFYDLANVDSLRRQVALARRAGIGGFCIHNYWFAGRKLLERPLELLLADKSIDMPFCLNWANESWSRRWDGSESELLMEQTYDPQDLSGYVRSILPALRDPRYIKVNGRPLIMVYRPAVIPYPERTFAAWRSFLIAEGIGDPYLVMAQVFDDNDPRRYGLDAAAGFPPHNSNWMARNERAHVHLLDKSFRGHVRSYDEVARNVLNKPAAPYREFPGVMPGWDNEARKPRRGTSFYGAAPSRYAAWLYGAAERALQIDDPDEQLVFINAWNEWAEGAILEPDRHYGFAFLVKTREVLDAITASRPLSSTVDDHDPRRETRPGLRHYVANRSRGGWRHLLARLRMR